MANKQTKEFVPDEQLLEVQRVERDMLRLLLEVCAKHGLKVYGYGGYNYK